ncbi:hypothetical protein HX870_10645 [Pseudomonas gingeri]|uniref:Uncharacterized protein n=1 Tax=Pseudomonas gingeri TaxID=117681 RepID=A0A7Y7X7J1_9PSED|nr:hypothetical protein [Pseudomonas gingeri]NWB94748.1 hypothetical protein [Pseudomonas gingeri]NWD68054.1 hypothetical protein [Pseudomonas gingeri]
MNDQSRHPASRTPFSCLMDINMIGATLGGACLANMLFPDTGSALVGALLGALAGFRAASTV